MCSTSPLSRCAGIIPPRLWARILRQSRQLCLSLKTERTHGNNTHSCKQVITTCLIVVNIHTTTHHHSSQMLSESKSAGSGHPVGVAPSPADTLSAHCAHSDQTWCADTQLLLLLLSIVSKTLNNLRSTASHQLAPLNLNGLELQKCLQAGCECWGPPALFLQPLDVLVPVHSSVGWWWCCCCSRQAGRGRSQQLRQEQQGQEDEEGIGRLQQHSQGLSRPVTLCKQITPSLPSQKHCVQPLALYACIACNDIDSCAAPPSPHPNIHTHTPDVFHALPVGLCIPLPPRSPLSSSKRGTHVRKVRVPSQQTAHLPAV